MIIATSIFFLSLAGITGLFFLKLWEKRQGKTIAPSLRDKADELAFRLKDLLLALQVDLEKLPPEMLHVSRIILHELALAVAALLRFLSLQAHRLAELVSHKHSFRRRAPRSAFLQKVIERKNGNAVDEVDTT